MDKNKPLLPVKSDFVFKLIFGDRRNVDILADFLGSVLDIPADEYERLTVVDPHVKKESKDDKYGIFDVKVHTKSGGVIQVEIQVEPFPDMKERIVYGQSKMVTEQMSSGRNWAEIKKVVTIVITDYDFVRGSSLYHHQFRNRTAAGIEFTDITEINTLELSKLPADSDNSGLWYWMKFIKTDDGEVLDMIEQKSPQMKKAVGFLKELSADERTRMLYEEREKARRDMVSRMSGARREGLEEGLEKGMKKGLEKGMKKGMIEVAVKLLKRNRPIEEIIEDTGLSQEEINRLSREDG